MQGKRVGEAAHTRARVKGSALQPLRRGRWLPASGCAPVNGGGAADVQHAQARQLQQQLKQAVARAWRGGQARQARQPQAQQGGPVEGQQAEEGIDACVEERQPER